MNIDQYDKPHNLEAERALLSYMLSDPSVIDTSIPIQAFYLEEHKDIFATMMMLKTSGSVIDAVTI